MEGFLQEAILELRSVDRLCIVFFADLTACQTKTSIFCLLSPDWAEVSINFSANLQGEGEESFSPHALERL
jgi:hypothetical protein